MATVNIPTSLRPLTNGAHRVDAEGGNLAEILDALEQNFPGIQSRICNEGELRRFIRISVNDEIVLNTAWHSIAVSPSDTVSIIHAIAGG